MAIDTSSGYYTPQAVNPRVMSEPDKKEPPNLLKNALKLGVDTDFLPHLYQRGKGGLIADKGLSQIQGLQSTIQGAPSHAGLGPNPDIETAIEELEKLRKQYGAEQPAVWEQLVGGEYETGGGLFGAIQNTKDNQAYQISKSMGEDLIETGTAEAVTGTETMAEMAGGGGLWTLLLLATMQGLMNPGSGVAKFNEKYLKPNLRLPS